MTPRHPLYLLLCLLPCIVCTNQPMQPSSRKAPEARYHIAVPALEEDSIRFAFTVDGGYTFIIPYHFYDNPLDSINGSLIKDLSVTDAHGAPVDTTTSLERIGPVDNYILHLPAAVDFPVTFSYRCNFSAIQRQSDEQPVPLVHAGDSSLFLIGAYCFMLPHLGTSLTTLWRTAYPIELTFEIKDTLQLYGIPDTAFTCRTLYELLFMQCSAGHSPVVTGSGGGTGFVVLDYLKRNYPSGLLDSMGIFFGAVLDSIVPLYGEINAEPFSIGIHGMRGALEGTYGFVMTRPDSVARRSVYEMLAHELLHYHIGIQCGEYDDQWWKEAAATYLAMELCVRMGYYEKSVFKSKITALFDMRDDARFKRPLSDPWLRANKFAQGVHGIVYARGAQVMMLLDVRVRNGSANRYTLHDVMAYLCGKFSGSAFYRSDFLNALEMFGAGDCGAFFEEYVDNSEYTLTEESLLEMYDQLAASAGF